jgi:hypothetical protein
MMTGRFFLWTALLAGAALSDPSVAVEPSGSAVAVIPDASAGGTGGHRVIEIKGPIFMGDVITTDLKGQVDIIFVDDTKFVVGANSKVMIDAFVFDADKTAQDVSISAVKGAFRFITGKSPKDNYSIRTPTMTIGVRGTAFDLAVRPGSGESMMVVHEGGTSVCDPARRCIDVGTGNMVVGEAGGGGVHTVPPGAERKQRLESFFPLIKSQAGLPQAFVLPIPASVQIGSGNGPPDFRHNDDGNDPPVPPPRPQPPAPEPDGRPPPR